jgi:hypothetical protein
MADGFDVKVSGDEELRAQEHVSTLIRSVGL